MVSAKLLQIFATGPQDKILYGNPKITYFKTVYKQHTNFGSNYIVKDLSNYADFGKTLRIKVPREGDLLGATYIRFQLSLFDKSGTEEPLYTSFCNGIGSVIIEEIGIYVGGKKIESFPGEWIMLDNELYNDNNRKKEFYKMIQYHENEFNVGRINEFQLISSTGATTNTVTTPDRLSDNSGKLDVLVPIPFFYTKESGHYLPVCAMNEENIEIMIKIRDSNSCLSRRINTISTGSDYLLDSSSSGQVNVNSGDIINEVVTTKIDTMQIIYNYYYLDDREKKFFINTNHRYIVPLTKQLISSNHDWQAESQNIKTTLDIKNPVKFIVWTLQRNSIRENLNDYFNFTYSPTVGTFEPSVINLPFETISDCNKYMVSNYNFNINGHPLLDKMPSNILKSAEIYNKFKTNSHLLFYTYSFALNPRDIYPSGTLNFSRIKNTDIVFNLEDKSSDIDDNDIDDTQFPDYQNETFTLTPYTVSYNILSIKDGLTGLEFI